MTRTAVSQLEAKGRTPVRVMGHTKEDNGGHEPVAENRASGAPAMTSLPVRP